jgi:hypothetical protein
MCADAALALDGDIARCGALQHRAGTRPRSLLRLFLTTPAMTASERRTRAGPSAAPGDQPVPRQLVFARSVMCRLTLMARAAGTTAAARQPEGCPGLGRPSAACGSLALSPLLPCEPRRPSHSLLAPARDMQVLCYRSDRLGFCRSPAYPSRCCMFLAVNRGPVAAAVSVPRDSRPRPRPRSPAIAMLAAVSRPASRG